MAALGIPTTRALAAVATGETVWRETPLPGAVFARVASSHIRIGTFQFFAARGDVEGIRLLVDHAIARHYPDAARAGNPALALLESVIARQADLVVQWLLVGFIHGVMNTDNMTISGETIDYGPCAFMDAYDPATVYQLDRQRRTLCLWQSAEHRVVESHAAGRNAVAASGGRRERSRGNRAKRVGRLRSRAFQAAYAAGLNRKLGLLRTEPDDFALAQDLLHRMTANGADFTLTFRRLSDAVADPSADAPCGAYSPIRRHSTSGRRNGARGSCSTETRPTFRNGPSCAPQIPRSFPAIIGLKKRSMAAVERNEFAPFETLLAVLSRPYDDQPEFAHYADPPRPDQIVHHTFLRHVNQLAIEPTLQQ
jgi:uncharacterized protein YdiU (UPF0061 family)